MHPCAISLYSTVLSRGVIPKIPLLAAEAYAPRAKFPQQNS